MAKKRKQLKKPKRRTVRHTRKRRGSMRITSPLLIMSRKELVERIRSMNERNIELAKELAATPPPYKWGTADGRWLEPRQMDEGHLRNSISYCARRLCRSLSEAAWLHKEHRWVSGLHHFLAEAERRGIQV